MTKYPTSGVKNTEDRVNQIEKPDIGLIMIRLYLHDEIVSIDLQSV